MTDMNTTNICPDCLTRSGLTNGQYFLLDKIVRWSFELIRTAEAELLGVRYQGRGEHPIERLTSDLAGAWKLFKEGDPTEPTDAQREAFTAWLKAEGNGGVTSADREREADLIELWRKLHPGHLPASTKAEADDGIPF